jgi:alkaline phosphatase D
MKIKNLYFLLILVSFLACQNKPVENAKPYVIMLSMDGFRWDYTDMTETPNFDKIAKMGVKAQSLKPCFPSKTFPNHYSMATGLYPDHHGIVLNSFYDVEEGRGYSIMKRETVEDGTFYGGEPIWNTAEKQGIKAGTYFWVGSEADVQGMHASYWKSYNSKLPFEARIDSVINWLSLPEPLRPHLVLWYFDEPDGIGHYKGPESIDIQNEIVYLDSLLGVFMNKLEKLPNAEKFNVIITSDHGMGATSYERKVALANHINMKWVDTLVGYNPNFVIRTKKGFKDSVYLQLKKVEHITTWKTGELPDRLNYGNNPRTLDIVVVADSSWAVVINEDKRVGRGAHGYDNDNKDMHAMFYAYGPAFKKNYLQPTFNNIDLYPLICEILNLNPAPVDGKLENVKGMLVE